MSAGHICSVVSLREFVENPSFDFDAYIFHRPSFAEQALAKILTRLKRGRKILIADYDDLIFGDESVALQSSIAKNSSLPAEQILSIFRNNLAGLQPFKKVTVSTRPLRKAVREANGRARVDVVENAIPQSVFDLAEVTGFWKKRRPLKNVGYFSGTLSHNRDFSVVSDVIYRLLAEQEDLQFWIIGPLEVEDRFRHHPRVHVRPHVAYWQLPEVMSRCTLCIAPLEKSGFNDCKSRVKFLEAGLSGCHLVATPIDDMTLVRNASITLPTTHDDWYRALSFKDQSIDHDQAAADNYAYVKKRCNGAIAAKKILKLVEA